MLEAELGSVDAILADLENLRAFYDFERQKIADLRLCLIKEQGERLANNTRKNTKAFFERESNNELKFLDTKISQLNDRIGALQTDIQSRNESRVKLIELFTNLNDTASLNFGDTDNEPESDEENEELPLDSLLDLPVMEIREELDENGDIINSEVKPYQSGESIEELLKMMNGKKSNLAQPKPGNIKVENGIKEEIDEDGNIIKSSFKMNRKTSSKKPAEQTGEESFRPFMIREEIDENGNIVESSASQIPDLNPDENDIDSHLSNDDDAQLAELFVDMGLKPVAELEEKLESNTEQKSELPSEIKENYKEPLKDTKESNHPITEITRDMYEPEIDPNDVITLEMIASELIDGDEEDEFDDDDWQKVDNLSDLKPNSNNYDDQDDDEEEEEDAEFDYDRMLGSQGGNLFMQQIAALRQQKKIEEEILEPVKDTPRPKMKKSVSFNSEVDVKPIENIWDDLRKSDYENQINDILRKNESNVSRFKKSMYSEDDIGGDMIQNIQKQHKKDKLDDFNNKKEYYDELNDDDVISDVIEQTSEENETVEIKPIVIVPRVINQAAIQNSMDSYQKNIESFELKKLGRKSVSRFKMARAAQKGKDFQDNYISPETKEEMRAIADKMIADKQNPKSDTKTSESEPVETVSASPKLIKFKKEFKSLAPPSNTGNAISTPKDSNPVTNTSVKVEDFEIIRNETNEDLFDDDDEGAMEEFHTSAETYVDNRENDASSGLEKAQGSNEHIQLKNAYFPEYDKKESESSGIVQEATLDYSTLNGDMDVMAKAYVLGLYDDDIETRGQVIEELKDFEEHNKEVESKQGLHERVTELNTKADEGQNEAPDDKDDDEYDDPMVLTDILEHDVDEIEDLNSLPLNQEDLELNDETLNQELIRDYTTLRKKMIYQFKGGFRETDKEKEFVQPDDAPRVSRFRAARLGM